MPAYIIVEVDITDQAQYEEYKKLTPATVEKYGGKFVLRGQPVEALEGKWNHDRLVMLQFPDGKSAKSWYNSKEYQEAPFWFSFYDDFVKTAFSLYLLTGGLLTPEWINDADRRKQFYSAPRDRPRRRLSLPGNVSQLNPLLLHRY